MTGLMAWRVAVAGVLLAGFQTPVAPPMKMGLWERTQVNTPSLLSGQWPKGIQPGTKTSKSRSCFTAETWKALLMPPMLGTCASSKQSVSGAHYSLDFDCMRLKSHMEGDFATPESGHGTEHTEVNQYQAHLVGDTTFELHWVSASCGLLAPGKTEFLH